MTNQLPPLYQLSKINQKSYNTEFDLNDINNHFLNINQIFWNQSYFLKGPTRAGKSFLAIQIMKEWHKKYIDFKKKEEKIYSHKYYVIDSEYYNSIFIEAIDLINLLQTGFGKFNQEAQEQFETIKKIKLLIIDDIGKEKPTDFVSQKLIDLINFRFNERLQTLFTSNLGLKELTSYYGEAFTARILSMTGKENCLELPSSNKWLEIDNRAITTFELPELEEIEESEEQKNKESIIKINLPKSNQKQVQNANLKLDQFLNELSLKRKPI